MAVMAGLHEEVVSECPAFKARHYPLGTLGLRHPVRRRMEFKDRPFFTSDCLSINSGCEVYR